MFLLVIWFSFLVSIYWIGKFFYQVLLKFSSNRQLLYLAELAFKEKGNYNNIIFEIKATKAKVM